IRMNVLSRIQTLYGHKFTLATAVVTQAASYDDQTAYTNKLVDLRAASLGDLLNQVDGRTAQLANGPVTLHTAGLNVQTLQPGVFDYFYSFLLDPNVIFLLFIVAMIGI